MTPPLVPGQQLGRYQILAGLGSGGMATVYKAYQPALDRIVALKVLRTGFAEDAEFQERFEREAKAVARLLHPHIVQVFDFERVEALPFMAMQYLEGGTLKAKLGALAEEGQRLPPRGVGRIVSEIAEGLGYAHALGIIHRDIKPSNIMFAADGKAVITDFGIAKILAAAAQHTLTTGVGIGTPEYMSPEQGRGLAVDARADIYALGVVAYEMLTGRVPYVADTPLAVALAHAHDPLPLPSALNPEVGAATERALLKALHKDPEQRFASAPEFAAALAAAVELDGSGAFATGIVRLPASVIAAGPIAARQVMAERRTTTFTLPVGQRSLVLGAVIALLLLLSGGGAAVLGVFGTAATLSPALTSAAPSTASPAARTAQVAATSAAGALTVSATATPAATPEATPTPSLEPTAAPATPAATALAPAPTAAAVVAPTLPPPVITTPAPATLPPPPQQPPSSSPATPAPTPPAPTASLPPPSDPNVKYAVSGRITSAVTGAGLAGVTATVYTPETSLVTQVTTDASGNYTAQLSNGSYRVWAGTDARTGFAGGWWRGSTHVDASSIVEVAGAPVRGIDMALAPGFLVSGTITDSTGAPLSRVGVVVYVNGSSHLTGTQSDTVGRYSVRVPNGSYEIVFYLGQGCCQSDQRLARYTLTVSGRDQTVNGRIP